LFDPEPEAVGPVAPGGWHDGGEPDLGEANWQ
jgi:hypothetical protein